MPLLSTHLATLLIVIIRIVVHHIEESKFIDSLTRAHNPQPITQLLFLEKFLRPDEIHSISIYSFPLRSIQPRLERVDTYRYLRYRPEKSVWATTSILPSPCWLICTVSPRLPTRPSTLILSWRNFSKAETSNILSEAGCEALMMNFCNRQ